MDLVNFIRTRFFVLVNKIIIIPVHISHLVGGGLVEKVVLPDILDCVLEVIKNFWERPSTHLVVEPLEGKSSSSQGHLDIHLIVEEDIVVEILVAEASDQLG